MTDPRRKMLRRFLLAGVFAAIHTGFFILIALGTSLSSDPEASMAYYLFVPLDYPVSRLYTLATFDSQFGMMAVLGGLLWFSYGFILQSIFSTRRIADLPRLGIGVLFAGLLCLLPEINLRSMPGWEEHWHRGTAAREAHNWDKAIRNVSEAIRLSPKNNPLLNGMWDYLGGLYMDQKDYDRAGIAFTNALSAATAKPNSRPVDLLNAYNQLAQFCERTGDKERRKECLQKAIEFNRIVYGAGSVQEAHCWHSLAQIAHNAGDSVEAQNMMERAIGIESSLPSPSTWSPII